MELYIDDRRADTDAGTSVSISLSLTRVAQFNSSRMGYTKTMVLPMTGNNMAIMGDSEQVNSPARFNNSLHTGRIEQDGFTVIEGVVFLAGCHGGSGGGYYEINIVGQSKEWVRWAAGKTLSALEVPFSEVLTGPVIASSWSWDKPVRFFPVFRDESAVVNVNGNLFPPQSVLTTEDYHPFIHLKSVFEQVFAGAGYGIESEFVGGPLFGSLYMSGRCSTRSGEEQKARMDFRAGRFATVSTVADYRGMVAANPYDGANTVGNIVDTANPAEERGGVTVEGVYTVGDCFGRDGDRVVFRPPVEVTMGVEYSLFYTTEYTMVSSRELRGIDRVVLDDYREHRFTLLNRMVDWKQAPTTGKAYRLIIFDHVPGIYTLEYEEITDPDTPYDDPDPEYVVKRTHSMFTTRTRDITFNNANRIRNATIQYRPTGTTEILPFTGDWALYDGWVQETGEVDVEVVLRSAPQKIAARESKWFSMICFGGADPGMAFTLNKLTAIRPVFESGLSEGSTIAFPQVAAHGLSCLDIVNAVRHMFDLCFYTDNFSKKVYIEPRDTFYRHDTVVDWSDRVDLARGIAVNEAGSELSRNLAFEYAQGDRVVAKYDRENATRLGRWTAAIADNRARDGETVYANPVFAPSLSVVGGYPDAASAPLLSVEKSVDEGFNFTPRVVRYAGMVGLPPGEQWGWPYNSAGYPLAAFHWQGAGGAPGDVDEHDPEAMAAAGFSLAFEDRDGIEGLHSYYDSHIGQCASGKRVEAWIRLGPEDVEPFIVPNAMRRDFRALFRLVIDGESALLRLEEICDYDPSGGGPTKCVFIK